MSLALDTLDWSVIFDYCIFLFITFTVYLFIVSREVYVVKCSGGSRGDSGGSLEPHSRLHVFKCPMKI